MSLSAGEIIFAAGFVAYVGIRGYFERRVKGVASIESRVGWLEWTLLALTFVGCILAPALYLTTSWLSLADYALPSSASAVGAAAMTAALWLFWRSHADLGRNWSRTLEIRAEHRLVRHGVYRLVRHPMYAAILLFCFAQGMMLRNWLAGWSGMLAFATLYVVRAPREESLLCERFGDDYRRYMRRTGRLIPRSAERIDEPVYREGSTNRDSDAR